MKYKFFDSYIYKVRWGRSLRLWILATLFPRPFSLYEILHFNKNKNQNTGMYFAYLSYQSKPVRTLIAYLKSHDDRELVGFLGMLIASSFKKTKIFQTEIKDKNIVPLLIPMPTPEKRLQQRGFNQVTRLASVIGEQLGYPLLSTATIIKLARNKQALLKRKERLQNQRGSFRIQDPTRIQNTTCIIIDDVWTTGATTTELAKELLLSGAHKVLVITIAH